VVDAIRYLDRTGCQWAALPADFPHPKLVSHTSWRRVALTVVRLTPYWR
jgi:putative transposase